LKVLSETVAENLKRVREKIANACARASRPLTDVQLVAVSKHKPIELIREALAAGQIAFGENYVQEAVDKINQLPQAEWHFIGSLQTNKIKQVAGSFALIHSVDRLKLAQALNLSAAAGGAVQPILLQIHLGFEETKHGFSIAEVEAAFPELIEMKNLSIRGLMSLPPLEETEAKARANFARLRDSLEQ
jgi:pyridoxal phosphate enzyme (YggS family)